jgi:hypothetical protein
LRLFLRAAALLCLAACTSAAPAPPPLLVDGQPDERLVLPAVVREVGTIAGLSMQRICVAQAEDMFSEANAQAFDPAVLAAMKAVDARVSGDMRDCRLEAWTDALPPNQPFAVMMYYRNGARWVLEMATRSLGSDGFDRTWFKDYVQRFKSGNALVFVRVDSAVHFIEVEPSAQGPRVVRSDLHQSVGPAGSEPDSDEEPSG